MLKNERQDCIIKILELNGIVKVTDIIQELNVSDMTIRRDLDELEKVGKLRRIHGGAESLIHFRRKELSHEEKQILNVSKKEEIAHLALREIQEGDIVFLGPGTTIELLAVYLNTPNVKVLTNSLSVFNILEEKSQIIEVALIGGNYRKRTGAFCGDITNNVLLDMRFVKTFISCNAIDGKDIMTATIEEGTTQQIVLNNSEQKYLLVDDSKFHKKDFYAFYSLTDISAVFTNRTEDNVTRDSEEYVTIINE